MKSKNIETMKRISSISDLRFAQINIDSIITHLQFDDKIDLDWIKSKIESTKVLIDSATEKYEKEN